MMLRASGVRKHYAKAIAPTLAGVDLDVPSATFVAITGASGTGKTTLLQILAGLLVEDAGTVVIDGIEPWRQSARAAARFRRQRLGILPQGAPLLPELDVESNVALPLMLDRDARARERARRALASLGVEALASRRPADLSGGEALRVALARAMVAAPGLILADEPTSHLDPDAGALALERLCSAARAGTTVVAVTHDREVASRADLHLRLADGRLL